MSGKSQTQQTTASQTTQQPWGPTIEPLNDVIGQIKPQIQNTSPTANETSALGTLEANAKAGNPYAPQIGGVASGLLSGGPDYTGRATQNYDEYRNYLTPFARGDNLDPTQSPFYQTVSNDVANRVNGMFAGAGRDLSGANLQTLSRGIAEGTAPLYEAERGRQLGAINSLYSGGNATTGLLSNLSQTSLGNQVQGIGAAGEALSARDSGANGLLAVEAMKRGLPIENISNILSVLGPIAGLGGTSNMTGQTNGTYWMSPAQQAQGWLGALGQANPFKFTMPVGGK